MGRAKKETLDYFQHDVKPGKTLFTLQSRFGNNGYAFWYKLLERLGETSGQAYDCRPLSHWHYLVAQALVTEEEAEAILQLLSELEAIDADLWQNHRIIWCQNYVDRHNEIYRKRNTEKPTRPQVQTVPAKPKRGKAANSEAPAPTFFDTQASFERFWQAYPKHRRVKKSVCLKKWQALKPDEALTETILQALEAASRSDEWLKQNGQFVPHPTTWLNQRRWEDMHETATTPQKDDLDFIT